MAELASIDRLAAAVGDDVAFLLVSPEDEDPVRAFLRRQPLGVEPVLERTLAPEALGAEALPHTVILDASGRIVLRHRGAAAWDTPEVEALLRGLVPPGGRRPEPAFTLAVDGSGGGAATWSLTVEVPRGWRLYAPDPGELGLPLTAGWRSPGGGTTPAGLAGPPAEAVQTAAGPVRVHRGVVTFSVEPPHRTDRALEVSWALCRDDRCVPGRSEIVRPRG